MWSDKDSSPTRFRQRCCLENLARTWCWENVVQQTNATISDIFCYPLYFFSINFWLAVFLFLNRRNQPGFNHCLSRCSASALYQTNRNAGHWKGFVFWCLMFVLTFAVDISCLRKSPPSNLSSNLSMVTQLSYRQCVLPMRSFREC